MSSSTVKEVINHSQAQKNTISSDESDENFEGQSPFSSSLENPKKSQDGSIEILTAVSTPPRSGISSKSVPKEDNFQQYSIPQSQSISQSQSQSQSKHNSQEQARSKVKNSNSIESMFETFHQSPSGEFKPTFYNPFEVKHRRRTSRSQVKILERAFMENCKPTALLRKNLARELNMSARSIQVWFQNRRAKVKSLMKNGKMTEMQLSNFLLEHNQIQHGKEQSETEEEAEEEAEEKENRIQDSENEQERKRTNQQPIKQNIKIFQNERRTLPYSKRFSGSVNTGDSENMNLGNSYPNQVRNRSYSLPEIQRSPKLPFKQLQEAIFGPPYQESFSAIQGQVPLQRQTQTTTPVQSQQQVPAPLTESSYYSSSLNAFQNYFRASNAALLQVQGNYYSQQPNCNSNSNLTSSPTQLQLPQLNFPTLNQSPCEYQVEPDRFRRPRSSSFAVGHRTNSNYPLNKNEYCDEEFSARHSRLSAIKEDSPISNYMSLEDLTCGFNGNVYFNEHDQDSSEMSNQINSLDLDYFMTVYNQMNEFESCASASASSNSSSLINSPSDSHNIHIYNTPNHHVNHHNIRPYSYQHQNLQPRHHNNNNNNNNNNIVGNFMPELAAFLPQPSNEILLSTLINDEHFLH